MASRPIDSVNPPGEATNAYRRLPSVLLDQHQVEVTDCRNETTAVAKSMSGYTMAVSFWMAKPPDVSFFSVHCTKPPGSNIKTADFTVLPHVVGVEGRFVLFRARFYSRYGEYEYFMYKAGDGESPSLDWVPPPSDNSLSNVREFGIMPRGHQGHYLLVALCDAPSDYQLRIYSSEGKAWCTRTLLNPCPGIPKIVPDKVIALGEGLLGWVDFTQGLLVCNFCQDPPGVRFIPLPEPLPGNREKIKASFSGASARWFRDLTCVNGVLKFVEMEHRDIVPESDPSNKEFLFDSDLIMSLQRKYDKLKEPRKTDGWRAVTWTRAVFSNCWSKGCAVDTADIIVDRSTHSFLLSGARGETISNLSLRDVYSAFPTLSQDGDDILYLKSFVEPGDQNGWVVAADPENKTVKALGVFSFDHHEPSVQALRPCTLSQHLNMTPGIEVSACSKTILMDSSAVDPNNISIHVDEPIFCEPRTPRKPLAEVNLAQKETQCVARNGSKTRFRAVDPVKSMKKLRKLIIAEKIRAQHESQNIVPDDHISRVHPALNNLLPQQNLNKLDGPCDPVYAPVTYTSNIHEYGNYQPPRQPPPPLEQQLMPSSKFGPHEAAQPCVNKLDGTSYHGYTQQLSFNSYACATHSDNGNCHSDNSSYQQQWKQPSSIQELPASAPSQQPPLLQLQLTPVALIL